MGIDDLYILCYKKQGRPAKRKKDTVGHSGKLTAFGYTAIVAVLCLLVASCGLMAGSESFNPRVYTETNRPSAQGSPLLGEPAAKRAGSLQCSEFTKDPARKDMLIAYVNITPAQWQQLLVRSGFTAKDAVTTPSGPMIFVTIDSVAPLVGADAEWLAKHVIAGPNPGPEAEAKSSLRFLDIVGMVAAEVPIA